MNNDNKMTFTRWKEIADRARKFYKFVEEQKKELENTRSADSGTNGIEEKIENNESIKLNLGE